MTFTASVVSFSSRVQSNPREGQRQRHHVLDVSSGSNTGWSMLNSVLIKKNMRHIGGVKCMFYIQLKSEALPLTFFEPSHADREIAFIQRRTISLH